MQLAFDMHSPIPKESYDYGLRSDGESHGLVLTKPHVVELILDLAGYTTDRDLGGIRLLEPACGHGAFLAPAIERLLDSARNRGRSPNSLSSALSAYDIVQEHVETTRRLAAKVCRDRGVSSRDAVELAESWIHQGDFLLAPKPGVFDTVVGNPPYVRIEQLPRALQREYRERFSTIYDRADLYVPFIERGLSLLSPQGLLSFICTDRWTLNKYGAPLRSFITRDFYVRSYFDLHRASPFESDVIAYPSIFAIGREKTSAPTVIASISTASPSECSAARAVVRGDSAKASGLRVHTCDSWFVGGDPWVLSSSKQLATLRELEERFPLLEDDGRTSVRIGVATGADKILIVPMGTDIEEDRLVPLVMREDILAGKVHDGHRFVIDTSPPEGGVVDLDRYPKLSRYLEQHRAALTQRHVGRKRAVG